MSQYIGKEQHGKWWMHCNGTLQRVPKEITTTKKFEEKSPHVIAVWEVRSELDYYRMLKQFHELREGTIPNLVA